MSSRLATAADGRLVAIVTDAGRHDHGAVLLVIGNDFPAGGRGVQWLGRSGGRPPTAKEQMEARTPYRAPVAPPVLADELPDEALAEAEAIRLARLEQQREPICFLDAA